MTVITQIHTDQAMIKLLDQASAQPFTNKSPNRQILFIQVVLRSRPCGLAGAGEEGGAEGGAGAAAGPLGGVGQRALGHHLG